MNEPKWTMSSLGCRYVQYTVGQASLEHWYISKSYIIISHKTTSEAKQFVDRLTALEHLVMMC